VRPVAELARVVLSEFAVYLLKELVFEMLAPQVPTRAYSLRNLTT